MSSLGGGGSPAGPTAQQQALQSEQAVTNAQLNLQENEQRKTILNALQGTRVFRGSALSRQVASDTAAATAPFAPPSANQQAPKLAPVGSSLLDNQLPGSGATPGQQVGSAISLISGGGAGGTGRIPTGPGRLPVGQA